MLRKGFTLSEQNYNPGDYLWNEGIYSISFRLTHKAELYLLVLVIFTALAYPLVSFLILETHNLHLISESFLWKYIFLFGFCSLRSFYCVWINWTSSFPSFVYFNETRAFVTLYKNWNFRFNFNFNSNITLDLFLLIHFLATNICQSLLFTLNILFLLSLNSTLRCMVLTAFQYCG